MELLLLSNRQAGRALAGGALAGLQRACGAETTVAI